MANMRDSDTSLWLHNKLGTSNDSWTGGSICSQLNGEVLRNIKECFPDLQTQVKLKLLLSFFHIPRRNTDEWRLDLEQILEVAVGDSELWVSMIAEALKTYPATGSLNMEISDLDEVRPIFTNLVNDLRLLVRKQAEQVMLPMECHYLNKQALTSVVGQQPPPTKHFTLKKKPKSALLRADLLQKSADVQSNLKKASAPVIPVRSRGMPRKMTDTTPLKGIPSRHPGSGSRSSVLGSNAHRPPIPRLAAGRKEGGVKLLDIADQPLGYAAKKRKRQQELEESAAKKATEAPAGAAAMLSPTTTPDYAAGLTTTTTAAAPSYMPATPQPATAAAGSTAATPTTPAPAAAAVATIVTVTPSPPPLTPVLLKPVVAKQAAAAATPAQTIATTTAALVAAAAAAASSQATKPAAPIQQVTQIRIQPQPAANSLQRRGLALTREQMLEAQDMFRTANKVTRPEKALILGFMAGSRDNPCPHLGNIVTIKLSEDQENVQQPDETYLTMLVETHFQMNYNNGEWKRIKKYRRLDHVVDALPAKTQTAALV